MGVDLLKHNQEAYEKITEAIADGKKKIAISHATGTGKSYLIAKLFEDYSNDKKLVLVPSTYISDQIKKLFEKYSIQNVDVILYQKLIKMNDTDIAAMDYGVVALDEYHHDAATKVWGSKVKTLIKTHSETIFFGTSATPIKTDGVNAIDELFEGNCASDLPLSESIAKKIVPLPKYVGALYTLDDELERLRKKVENATNTKEEKQEFYKKINAMRSQIEKSYGMPIILNKNIKDREGKYIVFCKNKKHLAEIKDTVVGWFRTAGCKDINAYVVHSSYENKDVEYKAFCEDTSHSLKLMLCVDMLNEGLHLENISGVLLLRPTKSSIVWHQQIGRAIEANNANTPIIIDAVNNFSAVGQGMELMKEIEAAVAKEKESDSGFDDSGFEDMDTFFVLEQVVEIQEMFAEIEGRLEGSWDLYIKALKQYKEREGDCLVSSRHIEVVGSVSVSLGNWCKTMRVANKPMGKGDLIKERKDQLDKIGFIWNVDEFNFVCNCKNVLEYYKKHQKYPMSSSQDLAIKRLGDFLTREKKKMREQGSSYPKWKKKMLKKYLPDLTCESNFEQFIQYLMLYKNIYGNLDIKRSDTINGFTIGTRLRNIKRAYEQGRLKKDKIERLEEIGLNLEVKHPLQFNEKIELAQDAISNGVIISNINRIYDGIDFYTWINTTVKEKYYNMKLEKEDICTIEKLIDKPIYKIFNNNGDFIKVIDALKDEEVGIYSSKKKAAEYICKNFGYSMHGVVISNYLNGKCKSPYKGRFIFEFATDEDIKKYVENNKVS